MTLRKRLSILILLAVILILSADGIMRINAAVHSHHNDMMDKIDLTAKLAVGSFTEPLWTYNDTALIAIGDAFFKDREIGMVTVTASNGSLLYSKQSYSPEYEREQLIVVEREISKQGMLIGKLSIGFTTYYHDMALQTQIVQTIAGIFLVCIILWLIISMVSNMVTKPLYELSDGTDEIASGNFDKILCIDSKDEIGRLADKFNIMSTNIQSMLRERETQYDQLNASHEELIAVEAELRSLYDEVVATNAELESSRQTVEEIFNAAHDGIVVHDGVTGEIRAVNRSMTEMFGYSEDEFKEQGIGLIVVPEQKDEAIGNIRKTISEGRHLFEAKTKDRSGNSIFLEINASPACIDSEVSCLAIMRDITPRKIMEQHMEYLRVRDALTGAYNRAYFETEMLRVQTGVCNSIGLLICDVDGLKLINDTLGHRQGDELLKQVAILLQGGMEHPNYVARIGGDEFAVVLLDPTVAKMEELEQRYREKVCDYNRESPHLPLSLSLGWAIEDAKANFDVLFKSADNNMYRQKMHQSHSVRSSIVQTMMKALEAKDHITEGHADRLADLMEKIGKKLGLKQGILADLRLLAKFHDIGKVGIPDSILQKPARLTEEEMAIMRQHCEIGFRIAKSSPDLAPIADWVLRHHEHWNCGGYPLGIGGETIPIQCRILSIVDSYDAMTSDRPYRKAMKPEDAIAEIRRCAGTQFDPKLAEEFIALLTQEGIQ